MDRKLIGIITRADIIRAEADHLNCENGTPKLQPEPSYVVYQTRSPSIGRGRLLVPVANPETAATLLQMAAAIARDRHYEIECVQVMLVSRHSSPAETQVRTAKSRRLLTTGRSFSKKVANSRAYTNSSCPRCRPSNFRDNQRTTHRFNFDGMER